MGAPRHRADAHVDRGVIHRGRYVLQKELAIVTEDTVIEWGAHLSMSLAIQSEEQLLPLDAVLHVGRQQHV